MSALVRRGARVVLAALLVAAALVGLGALSRVPYHAPGAQQAWLRLSWRTRSAAAQTCRPRTAAELEALPVHMRTPEVCETAAVVYRLDIETDDAPARSLRIRPAGARGDRPLFVFHQVPLAAGTHDVRVRFQREGGDADDTLDYEGRVRVEAGEILLVTIDEATGRLVLRRPGPPDAS